MRWINLEFNCIPRTAIGLVPRVGTSLGGRRLLSPYGVRGTEATASVASTEMSDGPVGHGKARHNKFPVTQGDERGAYLKAVAARRAALPTLTF